MAADVPDHRHVSEDLLRRCVREITLAKPLAIATDIAYTVDVIADRVDDALPEDYWMPASAPAARRAVITGMVQQLISRGE